MGRTSWSFLLLCFGTMWGPGECGNPPWPSVHCAVRREISPCTCRMQEQSARHTKYIAVACEGMTNFQQVIAALQGKFEKTVDIELRISHSTLDDLPQLSFQQLGLTIHKLFLNHNNLSALPESVFSGLSKAESFSLADNALSYVPQQILRLMPRIKVLDLNGDQIVNISSTDFQSLKSIHTLTMRGNCVRHLEESSLPTSIQKLTLSTNRIPSLNGTLRRLQYLEWILLDNNDLETLEGELPDIRPNPYLKWMMADHNKLVKLPQQLKQCFALQRLDMSNNRIVSLDGAISTARQLEEVKLDHNNISVLYAHDFLELTRLNVLMLGHNRISNLNSSMLPLKNLVTLNLTHNEIVDFNLQELRGLRRLSCLDVSHNLIRVVSGKFGNSVELEPKVIELHMEYNELRSLYGGLTGFAGLQKVNLSHNLLESITADDVQGLDDLLILDISYNRLTTLDGTSQVVLKSLDQLLASHNWMESLETDFYGLPKLCWADFAHNKITTIDAGLADKTQCRLHSVNSTLRIYLQGNPAMCNEASLAAISQMESKNNTKVHGVNECPPLPPPTTKPPTTPAPVTTPTTVLTTTLPTILTTTPPTLIVTDATLPAQETTTMASMSEPTTAATTTTKNNIVEYQNLDTNVVLQNARAIQNGTDPQRYNAAPEQNTTTPAPNNDTIEKEPSFPTTTTLPAVVPPPQVVAPKTTPMPRTSTTPKMTVIEIIEIVNENSTEFTANDLNNVPVNLP